MKVNQTCTPITSTVTQRTELSPAQHQTTVKDWDLHQETVEHLGGPLSLTQCLLYANHTLLAKASLRLANPYVTRLPLCQLSV